MNVAIKDSKEQLAWAIAGNVRDPEIPVLTLADLGVIRSIEIGTDSLTVGIAPTYSGCPATEFIEQNVIEELQQNGFSQVRTKRVLSPAWSRTELTDFAGVQTGTTRAGDLQVLMKQCALGFGCLVGRHDAVALQLFSAFVADPVGRPRGA